MIRITISSTLFVGDANSILITDNNFEQYVGVPGHFHTSLGDISAGNLLKITDKGCTIIFVDEGFEQELELFNKTKIFLNSIYDLHQVTGYVRPGPCTFAEESVSRPAEPTLWIFGCSLSAGVGVEKCEVYSSKLGDTLRLPVTNVVKAGSSTRWSLRQLLHSDLQPDDVVVWQLTTVERSTVKHVDTWPEEVMLKNQSREIILSTTDEQLWFDQISLLDYGVQYLRAKRIRFYIVSFDSKSTVLDQCLEQYTRYPEYCYASNWQVDLGNDQFHPGSKSHHCLFKHLHRKITLAQRL
jgi:hypothetical protein